jgi:hypothetical protein
LKLLGGVRSKTKILKPQRVEKLSIEL